MNEEPIAIVGPTHQKALVYAKKSAWPRAYACTEDFLMRAVQRKSGGFVLVYDTQLSTEAKIELDIRNINVRYV